jgi:hypothetical protein
MKELCIAVLAKLLLLLVESDGFTLLVHHMSDLLAFFLS